MGHKIETIRKALNHAGIPITDGIPEHIIDELQKNGYVIRKSKAWKKQQKQTQAPQPKKVKIPTQAGAMGVNVPSAQKLYVEGMQSVNRAE